MMEQLTKAEIIANEGVIQANIAAKDYARKSIECGIGYPVSELEREAFLAGVNWAIEILTDRIRTVASMRRRRADGDV
jgi:hypothetical protein